MRVIVVLTLATVAAACGGSDNGPTTPASTNKTWDVLTIEENFQSPLVTIAPGDTVRWTFNKALDGLGHNVRFTSPKPAGTPPDIGSPGSPLTSGTQSRVFNTKGTFNYVCDLHGGMTGEVVVQ